VPDYYSILGLPRDASQDDIKRAYRKLARESNPDANPSDPHAEDRFKSIAEAYDVLSDPQKKQRYDTFGDASAQSPFGGAGGFGDLGDILENFFGGSPFGRTRTRRATSAVPGQDIGVSVTLTLEEAVTGVKHEIELESRARCEKCNGDGCEPGTYRTKCSRCGGQGEIRATRNTILGTVMTSQTCGVCGGAGEAPSVPCTECRGDGRTVKARAVTVDIPAGIANGMTVRVRGQGEAGVRGGGDGDLYVGVIVVPHEVFEREGDDLLCALSVPLTQAVLGAEIPVQTIDGEEVVTIPPGTQHGTVLRVRGHGVPRINGGRRGDLLLHVSVAIPDKLKGEERELFERLATVRGETVTGKQKGVLGRLRDMLGQ
jgi:molecular chaperone DnaJ